MPSRTRRSLATSRRAGAEFPVGGVLPSLCAGLLQYDAAAGEMTALTEYEEIGGYAIGDAS
ncbi:hypothetical protein [Nocardioides sp. YIM 152588]|uniref:hypothetical protein n=1 Tax=Nocardioides sp. YIM 152588 TaxID=3158259 RepID=UPI0032E3ACBB